MTAVPSNDDAIVTARFTREQILRTSAGETQANLVASILKEEPRPLFAARTSISVVLDWPALLKQ